MEKISFVIPCYNSEHTVADVIGRVITTVQNHGGYDYEVVCVNDYSNCLLYTSPSPRDGLLSRMPSSA